MRRLSLTAILVVISVLAACGQVEPVIMAVSMPECTYQGPVRMEEGEVSLSLSLNGLGRARVLLVELEDGHEYGEVEEQLEESTDWDSRPEWLRPVIDLQLSDAQGVAGVEDTAHLTAGQYVVVCVDEGSGEGRPASPLEVRGS